MTRLYSLMRRCRGPFILLSALVLTAFFWGMPFRSSAAPDTRPAVGDGISRPASQNLQWQGVASCAAMACHGGNGPKGSKGSEYTTWVLDDKHTKAYLVLFDDRSQLIERNLRQLKTVKEAHAERDQLCLRCHAMNPDNGPQHDRFVRDFGIGCESCHGVAEKWLGLHYGRDWSAKSSSEKRELGFQPMKSLVERAQLCATCHIGDKDREVNHDLLAAGHPRLNFEFGAFQAIMPKHWREEDNNAAPDFEARAWAVGQIVSAEAALSLLAHRAETTALPWPEFAEYDCFACHHDLREPSWRQQPGHFAKRTPGVFPWGTWYYPLLQQALPGSAGKDNSSVANILRELTKEMQKPLPNRKQIADQAHRASTELFQLLGAAEKVPYDRTALEQKFNSIRRDDPKIAATDWDGAAQVYLALAALYNALGDMNGGNRDPAARDSLKERARRLEFPKAYDSPRDFEPRPSGEIREKAPR
jgi:hypothetical protein